MSSNPIEFLHDVPGHTVEPTEYGGSDGVIQPALTPRGDEGHSVLTEGETSNVLARAGRVPLTPSEARSGVLDPGKEDGTVIDPVTGRVVDPDMNEDVTAKSGGTPSDLKPS